MKKCIKDDYECISTHNHTVLSVQVVADPSLSVYDNDTKIIIDQIS